MRLTSKLSVIDFVSSITASFDEQLWIESDLLCLAISSCIPSFLYAEPVKVVVICGSKTVSQSALMCSAMNWWLKTIFYLIICLLEKSMAFGGLNLLLLL